MAWSQRWSPRSRPLRVLGVSLVCALAAASSALWPGSSASAERRRIEVTTGDTLSGIAERHRVSVAQLQAWNNLRGNLIQAGQSLFVTPPGERRVYRAVPGDTLSCIALRHGVSTEEVLSWNPGLDASTVQVGSEITIFADEREAPESPRMREHAVQAGETLESIARESGVSVAALRAANSSLDPLRMQVGEVVQIPGQSSATHRVAAGDSFSSIARRYHTTVQAIRRANPEVSPRRLRSGQELVVPHQGATSESVGLPHCGSLRSGQVIPEHQAYVIRNPSRAYGTEETIAQVTAAFDRVRRRHRRAPRVRVHDLSLPGGGAIDDHRSHQSGRDIDITYYQREGCEGEGCPLREVEPEELLVGPQWTLIHSLLRRGHIAQIYIDYRLQRPLYREAQRRGATAAQLEEWFQFPRGRGAGGGIIRHLHNHGNHMHVRFRCPRGDASCR